MNSDQSILKISKKGIFLMRHVSFLIYLHFINCIEIAEIHIIYVIFKHLTILV